MNAPISKEERRELMPISYFIWKFFNEEFGKLPEFHAEENGERIDYIAKGEK